MREREGEMQEKNEGSAEGGRGKRSKQRQGRRLKEQLPDMHNQAPGMHKMDACTGRRPLEFGLRAKAIKPYAGNSGRRLHVSLCVAFRV